MTVTIKEVKTKKDLNDFIRFPHKLYKDNLYWVPPLDFDEKLTLSSKTNPAFEFCKVKFWLAYKKKEIVGRIAGIINNRYIETWKKKYARFGWLDFIDDSAVPNILFNTVETWARDNDMDAIQGPLGFTDFDKEGLLIDGFDEFGNIATIYNYPYYQKYIEENEYKKDVDWIELRMKIPEVLPEKVKRISDIARKKFKLRPLRMKKSKDLLLYAKELFYLLNDTYSHLYGFVPLTEKQIAFYTKQYFSFIRPDFVCVVLDKDNKLAAVGVTMPNLSSALKKAKGKVLPFGFIHLLKAMKKNTMADMFLIGVRRDLQGKGVNAIIMDELHKTYKKNNIGVVEASPELESNKIIQAQWKYYDPEIHKKRRCFIKKF